MEKLLEILKRMRKSVKFLREDTADEIRVMEREYKSTKAAHGAMKAAQALLVGGSAKDLYDEASEFLVEDIAMKMGEVETFFELSEDFMSKVDLQEAVWDEEGMAMLERWEQEGTLLSYEGKKVRVAEVPEAGPALAAEPAEMSVGNTPPSQFASFFSKDD
jgi:hypothetical protein